MTSSLNREKIFTQIVLGLSCTRDFFDMNSIVGFWLYIGYVHVCVDNKRNQMTKRQISTCT